MSYFGKNIRKIRNLKNLSQQAMAEVFELKRGALGAYEEGRSEPKIETLIRFANYFGISIDDLLTKELTVNDLLKFQGDKVHSVLRLKTPMTEIPLITSEHEIDYLKGGYRELYSGGFPKMLLPLDGKGAQEMCAWQVNSLEMSKGKYALYPGDIVIGERMDVDDYATLKNNALVMVVGKQKIILRMLVLTEGEMLLRASDPNFEDIQVHSLKDFKEVWRIQHVLHKNMGSKNEELEDRIRFIESELRKLKDSM